MANTNANVNTNEAKGIIYVERETYISKKGKECFAYFIKGKILGKEVRIAVGPPKNDFNGYTVLDIVFTCKDKAELVVAPFEIVDDAGKTIKGNTFAVRNYDESGKAYECKIVPIMPSDKNLLTMLLG